MRSITTAAAFAIAASLVAGQESDGKSGKSGTKSSKSGECTSCSAETITRATMWTDLFVSNWAVDGEITQASTQAWCDADTATKAAFLQALDNAAGCLVNSCHVDFILSTIVEDGNIPDGEFQARILSLMCFIEYKYGYGGPTSQDTDCDGIANPCAVLPPVDGISSAVAIEEESSSFASRVKEYLSKYQEI